MESMYSLMAVVGGKATIDDGASCDASTTASEGECDESFFDASAFPAFEPLLCATETYAQLSGSRFRSCSFDVAERDDGEEDLASPRRRAVHEAAPAVREFERRVRAQDPELLEELRTAHSLLMAETVRNAMVTTCKRLEAWPPELPEENTLTAEDLYPQSLLTGALIDSLSFPVVAQRLFDEEEVRATQRRVARTAAFLVEFMEDLNVPRPALAETLQRRLARFSELADAWERQREATKDHAQEASASKAGTFASALGLDALLLCAGPRPKWQR